MYTYLHTTGIRRDNDFVAGNPFDIFDQQGFSVEIVDGYIKEALNLGSMQIHSDESINARHFNEVGDQFASDWRSRLVLLVLTSVTETRNHRCHAFRGSALHRVRHDEQFHQVVVDIGIASRLDDIYIAVAARLLLLSAFSYIVSYYLNFNHGFTIGKFADLRFAQRNTKDLGNIFRKLGMCCSGEQLDRRTSDRHLRRK